MDDISRENFPLVLIAVLLMPFPVFKQVFEGGGHHYNDQGDGHCGPAIRIRDSRNHLQNYAVIIFAGDLMGRLTWRMQSIKKYKFANLVNCWNRFIGKKVSQVYFDVLT